VAKHALEEFAAPPPMLLDTNNSGMRVLTDLVFDRNGRAPGYPNSGVDFSPAYRQYHDTVLAPLVERAFLHPDAAQKLGVDFKPLNKFLKSGRYDSPEHWVQTMEERSEYNDPRINSQILKLPKRQTIYDLPFNLELDDEGIMSGATGAPLDAMLQAIGLGLHNADAQKIKAFHEGALKNGFMRSAAEMPINPALGREAEDMEIARDTVREEWKPLK
jgi:hypothetical protein